jgi:serine/threonine protein kinase
MAPGAVVCPSGHNLIGFIAPIAGFSCNKCSLVKNAAVGAKFYSCRQCDFDVCPGCYGQNEKVPAPVVAENPNKSRPHSAQSANTDGPSAVMLRQLQVALENPAAIKTHAKAWFKKFDSDKDGLLSLAELQDLCAKLNTDLKIPSVDPSTVEQVMRKFDKDDDKRLSTDEFANFYERLLLKVRDHYGGFRARRDCFIEKRDGKPPSERYRVKKLIGQGSYGVVSLVEDTLTKREAVLKTVNKAKSKLPIEVLEMEFKNLKMLDHPHIIKLFDYYEDYANIFIVMELAEGGGLLDVIETNYKNSMKMTEEKWACEVIKQVLDATGYCHSMGVMNKDIKADNIMLIRKEDPVHAVVLDFGLAEAFSSTQARTDIVSGTPYTMAPEIWYIAASNKGSAGYKCDIYSIGCVMFQILTGEFPIVARGIDPNIWLNAIKKGPNWDKMRHCSSEAVDLCKKLIAIKEDDRPTAKQALNHPWFKLSPEKLTSKLTPEMTKNLVNFSQRSSFEKAVLLQVATLAKAADIPQINGVYKSLQYQADGSLDRIRCGEALVKLGMPKEFGAQVAKHLDVDGNNKIEYTEFVAGVLNLFEDHLTNILCGVFTQIDTDKDGSLQIEEIRSVLQKGEINHLGLLPSSSEIDKTMEKLDKDKSGKVSFEEFKQFFMERLKNAP